MLHLLPAEIALHVISRLPLQSLHSISLVSHAWNDLITINEPAVYRNAAMLHHFIDMDQLCSDPVTRGWKNYCRRQLEIERGWRGKAPSTVRELSATGTTVHRFKVDYELGLVIATHQTGGLSVCDIKNNHVLWSLPSTHTVRYAHCEYDRGYIVFNRNDNCKEVWRRTVDVNRDPSPEISTSPPDKMMLDASVQAAEKYNSVNCHRGHFKAWALLRIPEHSCAFRFSYPTLLCASKDNGFIWDVPRSRLVSIVEDVQRIRHNVRLGSIRYVEVNDLYVFICGENALRIFSREGGALLYQLCPRELSTATWSVLPQRGMASSIVQPQLLLHNHATSSYPGEFIACHVSPQGDELVILTSNGGLVVLPNFQRLFAESNAVHHRDIVVILKFQLSPSYANDNTSYYLAVGGRNGRFALATRNGIFIISPDVGLVTAERPPGSSLVAVSRLSHLDNALLLSTISCLQITQDALYVTYNPSFANVAAAAHHPPLEQLEEDIEIIPHGINLIGVDEDMEDGFEDGWEDEDEEGEEMMGMTDEDPMEAIVQHLVFSPRSLNTVYSVKF